MGENIDARLDMAFWLGTTSAKGEKMKHKILAVRNLAADRRAKVALAGGLVLALALMGWLTSALAITWGEADEANAYPNVGAFMVQRARDDAVVPLCSGTLIHEQVFLTAAHCTAYAEELLEAGTITDVYVSFDFDVSLDGVSLLDVAEVVTHSEYDDFADLSNPHDVGALVLAEPVEGIEQAALPTEGFLNDLKRDRVLREDGPEGAKFTVVGYGGVLDGHASGLPQSVTQIRRATFAHMGFGGLELAGLVDRGIDAGIGDQLFNALKAVHVTDFSQDSGASGQANAGDGSDMLRDLSHKSGQHVIVGGLSGMVVEALVTDRCSLLYQDIVSSVNLANAGGQVEL
jgi:hypothetical protein